MAPNPHPFVRCLAGVLLYGISGSAEPLRITFVGDIMLDGGPGHLVTQHLDPFGYVTQTLLDSDVTIGNLECAITRRGHAEDKTYTFKGPLESLSVLKRYFTAVSLANNHSGDWGRAGFADELVLLGEAKLPWFGGGRNERAARAPFVVERRGHRVCILGYNEYPPNSFAATATKPGTAWLIERNIVHDVQAARQQSRADLVMLYLHWGEELEERPTQAQVELAHRLIDAGADAIIGGHPHVTQTIEWYKDRPIVYSLGNFVFDYFPHDPMIWTGHILRLDYDAGSIPRLSTVVVQLDASGIPHPLGAL